MIHYSFIGYIIACAIILLIATGEYRLLMENKVKPSINRIVLLSTMVISVVMPFIIALIPDSPLKANIEIGDLIFGGIVEGNNVNMIRESRISYYQIYSWFSWIYFTGVFIVFIYSFFAVARLLILMKRSSVIELNRVEVFLHNSKALSSFSWLNRIFLYNDSLYNSEEDLKILLKHELAHLNKGHWIDLAFAQIILIFQWFNPAVWFIRRELQRIHEYEADQSVLSSGIEEKEYQMLLIRNISRTRFLGLTDGLNNCSLKKRIIMMKKTDFKRDWLNRGIVVGVSLIFGGAIIQLPAVASVLEQPMEDIKNLERITEKNNTESIGSKKDSTVYLKWLETEKEILASKSGNKEFPNDKSKGILANYPDAYVAVDKVAEYEGGQSQLMKDLIETITYPEEVVKNGIQGRVVVRFQINTNGTLSNCEVAYSQNPILNESALKAVENLPGKWEPAEIGGKPVASVFNMPVTFKVQ